MNTPKIRGIDLSKMTNNMHYQLISDILTVANDSEYNELDFTSDRAKLVLCFQTEDRLLKIVEKSEHTARIASEDKRRDKVYGAVKSTVKTALKSIDPATLAAAERLQILLDTYGDIVKLPLSAQTAATTNVLQDLKGKYNADCIKTGVAGWITELETLNNSIQQLMSRRFDEESEKPTVTLREARKQTDGAYRAMIDFINATMVYYKGLPMLLPQWSELIARLNAVIAGYANVMAQQKGRRNKKNETADAEEV